MLGHQATYRIMLDTAISGTPKALEHTSNPVVILRALFDSEYYNRIIDWGGGYPRPMYEIATKNYFAYGDHPDASIHQVEHLEGEYKRGLIEEVRSRLLLQKIEKKKKELKIDKEERELVDTILKDPRRIKSRESKRSKTVEESKLTRVKTGEDWNITISDKGNQEIESMGLPAHP